MDFKRHGCSQDAASDITDVCFCNAWQQQLLSASQAIQNRVPRKADSFCESILRCLKESATERMPLSQDPPSETLSDSKQKKCPQPSTSRPYDTSGPFSCCYLSMGQLVQRQNKTHLKLAETHMEKNVPMVRETHKTRLDGQQIVTQRCIFK